MAESEPDRSEIYEPLLAFKNHFKDLHHKNSEAFLDDLVIKSGVDVPANRETNTKIKSLNVERSQTLSQIRKFATFRVLLILATLASAFSVYVGGQQLAQNGFGIWYFLMIPAGIAGSIYSIYAVIKKINPKLKDMNSLKRDLDEKIASLTATAWDQMKALNGLFEFGLCTALFEKTLPLIHFDKMFDRKKLEYLIHKFGHKESSDSNRSTLHIQSGDINGNPFYIANDLIHTLGTKTYHGSLTIRWTTTSWKEGKEITEHHSQTLHASVEKECPYFWETPYLVYGNEAAPDLIFSREDSDAENMNQKQIEKMVGKEIKKLNKLSEASTSKGQNFTVLGNSEFEVLFGAKNRNNEVQFRMLFTPLAQKQLLQLFKEKEIGFGDNFDFVKLKKINTIYPEHLGNIDLNVAPAYFHGYDIDVVRSRFVEFNEAYFRHIFFAFAPLLSIPLYQQQKPHEYIYKDSYDCYLSYFEHEHVANKLDIDEIKHPLSGTRNILKTSTIASGNHCDTIRVTAFGYRTEERVEFVTMSGDDDRIHQVPVEWTEYIAVAKETDVSVNVSDENTEKTEKSGLQNLLERLKADQISEKEMYQIGSLIARIVK